MAVKRKYRLNLRNYGNLPAIMLSQYDEGYALEFEIRDGTDAASDLSAYTVTLKGTRADTLAYSFAGTISTNVLTFVIDTTMTACAGRGTAEIAIKDTANDVLFATFNMPVFVERAAVPEGSIDADVERAQEIAEQVQEIVDNAAAAVSGEAEKWATGQINGTDVPSTDPAYENNAKYYAEQAETAAESIGIDATLTQAGKAADSKKTGDEITALKEDLNIFRPSATSADVGKALIVKTVSDGVPTSFEYGETGGDASELEADIDALKTNVYSFGTVTELITVTINTGYGYKKDGTTKSYSTMRCTDYIDVTGWLGAVVTAFNSDGEWAGVCYFDENHDFVSYALGDGGSGTNVEISIPSGVKYMTLTKLNADPVCTATRYKLLSEVKEEMDSVVDAENLPNPSKSVAENIVDMNTAIDDVSDTVEQIGGDFYKAWGEVTGTLVPSVTSGEYYKISDGTIGTYSACKRTDLIDITGWKSANVTCYGLNTNYAGVCYYDKNQTYISGEYDNGRYTDAPLHIPANAKYIGVSSHNSFTISITYTRYITPSEVANTVDSLKTKVLDGCLDKNIVLFGDSVTDVNVNGKWVKEIQKVMKFKSLTDYARGYCQWCFNADTVYDIASTGNTGDASNVIWNQYNRLVADVVNEVIDVPDAIFIFAGVNDAIYNKTIGTVADAMEIADIRSAQVGTLTNVCASIRRVIEDIYATFPYTKIFVCTPLQNGSSTYETRLHNIVPCIHELCANYAIDVVDLNKNSGITHYVEKDSHVFLADGTHPTDAGGKHIANYIKSWMLAHYGYDETTTKTYVPQT